MMKKPASVLFIIVLVVLSVIFAFAQQYGNGSSPCQNIGPNSGVGGCATPTPTPVPTTTASAAPSSSPSSSAPPTTPPTPTPAPTSTATATAFPTSTPVSGFTAQPLKTSDSLADEVGINWRGGENYGNTAGVSQAIETAGIRHVRGYDTTFVSGSAALAQVHNMMNLGVGFTIGTGNNCLTDAQLAGYLNQELPYVAHIDGFEQANEVNANTSGLCGYSTWQSYASTRGPQIYADIRSFNQSNVTNIPTIAFSLCAGGCGTLYDFGSLNELYTGSNGCQYCDGIGNAMANTGDILNFHNYPGSVYPLGQTYGSAYLGCPALNFRYSTPCTASYENTNAAGASTPLNGPWPNPANSYTSAQKLWTTEYGWGDDTTSGFPPAAADTRYIPRAFLVENQQNISRLYYFNICNGESGFVSYGVLTNCGSTNLGVKSQYTAIQSFENVYSDPNQSFSPGKLNETLSGTLTNVNSAFNQKHDGTILVSLWQEVSSNSGSTLTTVASQNVTFTVPYSVNPNASSPQLVNFNDDGTTTTSPITFTANGTTSWGYTASIRDAVSVIEFKDASGGSNGTQPTPAPGGSTVSVLQSSGQWTNSAQLQINMPQNPTQGNVEYLTLNRNPAQVVTFPSGQTWNAIGSACTTSDSQVTSQTYWHLIGSGETSQYNFPIAPSGRVSGTLAELSGASSTAPFVSAGHSCNTGSSTAVSFASVVPNVSGNLVLANITANGAETYGTPASYTGLGFMTSSADFHASELYTYSNPLSGVPYTPPNSSISASDSWATTVDLAIPSTAATPAPTPTPAPTTTPTSTPTTGPTAQPTAAATSNPVTEIQAATQWTNSGSLNITLPSAPQVGNVIYEQVGTNTSSQTLAPTQPSSGWHVIGSSCTNGTETITSYYHVVAAADNSQYPQFSVTPTGRASGTAVELSNVSTVVPFLTAGHVCTAYSNSANASYGSVTPTSAGSYLIAGVLVNGSGSPPHTISTPLNFTSFGVQTSVADFQYSQMFGFANPALVAITPQYSTISASDTGGTLEDLAQPSTATPAPTPSPSPAAGSVAEVQTAHQWTNSTQLQITLPAAPTAGHVEWMMLTSGTSPTVATPTGQTWTAIGSACTSGSNTVTTYWHVVQASESAQYNMVVSSSGRASGSIVELSNASTTAPFPSAQHSCNTASGTAISFTAVTPSQNGSLALLSTTANGAETYTTPTGYTAGGFATSSADFHASEVFWLQNPSYGSAYTPPGSTLSASDTWNSTVDIAQPSAAVGLTSPDGQAASINFFPNNALARPIPTSPAYDPQSAAMITEMDAGGNLGGYNITSANGNGVVSMSTGHSSDPSYTFNCLHTDYGTCGMTSAHIPTGTTSGNGSDFHNIEIDAANATYSESWLTCGTGTVAGGNIAGSACTFPISGNTLNVGYGTTGTQTGGYGDGTGFAATGSHIAMGAGIIRPIDLLNGSIPHGIFAGFQCALSTYVYPATSSDANGTDTCGNGPYAPKYGQVLQLDSAGVTEMEAINPHVLWPVIVASNVYGMYIGDRNEGSTSAASGADIPTPETESDSVNWPKVISAIQADAHPVDTSVSNGQYHIRFAYPADIASHMHVLAASVMSATPTPVAIANHINTVAYVGAGQQYTGTASAIAPYLTYAYVPTSGSTGSSFQSAGVKVGGYADASIAYQNYRTTTCAPYNTLVGSTVTNTTTAPYLSGTPTGTDAGGIAKDSSNNYITNSSTSNPGILVDPTNSYGVNFFSSQTACLKAANQAASPAFTPDWVFSDDTLVQGDGNYSATPSDYTLSGYVTGVINEENASTTPVLGANTVSLKDYGIDTTGIAAASNVKTLMFENFLNNNPSTSIVDMTSIHGATGSTPWYQLAIEAMDEVHTNNSGKGFWAYPEDCQSDSSATAILHRTYFLTSFMLGYQPQDIFEECYTMTSGSQIEPETQIVPLNPLIANPANLAAVKIGNIYAREFANCYYAGTSIGRCAFVVNPSGTASNSIPALSQAYAHSATITGSSVLDGGTVTFTAAAPTTLAGDTGVILVQ